MSRRESFSVACRRGGDIKAAAGPVRACIFGALGLLGCTPTLPVLNDPEWKWSGTSHGEAASGSSRLVQHKEVEVVYSLKRKKTGDKERVYFFFINSKCELTEGVIRFSPWEKYASSEAREVAGRGLIAEHWRFSSLGGFSFLSPGMWKATVLATVGKNRESIVESVFGFFQLAPGQDVALLFQKKSGRAGKRCLRYSGDQLRAKVDIRVSNAERCGQRTTSGCHTPVPK